MAENYKEWNVNVETTLRVRETTDTLIEMLIKPECFKRELFFALLLILMKENDFLLLAETADGEISICDCIVSLRKNNIDNLEATFVLKGYDEAVVKLITTPMKDLILINCVIPRIGQRTYSMCLALNRYVVSSEWGVPIDYSNMDELSTLFKDKIITPVRSSILNYNNLPSGTLAGLPIEVMRAILLRLPLADILNLSESCKRINGIVNEDSVWSQLFNRDFPDRPKKMGFSQDLYKDEYINKKEKENNRRPSDITITKIETSGYMMYSCVPDPRWEVIL